MHYKWNRRKEKKDHAAFGKGIMVIVVMTAILVSTNQMDSISRRLVFENGQPNGRGGGGGGGGSFCTT